MIQFFHAPGSRTIKAFNEAVSAELLPNIEMHVAFRDSRPKAAHVVLVAGDGAASKEAERYAWRLGAFPVYVPEASEWLSNQIRKRIELGAPFVMVDAALASTEQLSGAK